MGTLTNWETAPVGLPKQVHCQVDIVIVTPPISLLTVVLKLLVWHLVVAILTFLQPVNGIYHIWTVDERHRDTVYSSGYGLPFSR